MKKYLVLLGAALFLFVMTGSSFAGIDDDFFTGSVTKIQGSTVTVKNAAGQEKTFQAASMKGLKVGDKVRAKGSMVQSWDWGNTAPKTKAVPGSKSGIRAEDAPAGVK